MVILEGQNSKKRVQGNSKRKIITVTALIDAIIQSMPLEVVTSTSGSTHTEVVNGLLIGSTEGLLIGY